MTGPDPLDEAFGVSAPPRRPASWRVRVPSRRVALAAAAAAVVVVFVLLLATHVGAAVQLVAVSAPLLLVAICVPPAVSAWAARRDRSSPADRGPSSTRGQG